MLYVPPSRVPISGPPAHASLAVGVLVLVSVIGFAMLGGAIDHPAPSRLPAERPAASPSLDQRPTPTHTVIAWAPTSPQTVLAVSAVEAWSASWVDGLWHFEDGTWISMQVARWEAPLRVFDVARSPDGLTLAVGTEHGAAVLRDDAWRVLEAGQVHDVAFSRDGTLWVVSWFQSTEATVVSLSPGDRTWDRTLYPSLTVPSRPRLALGPEGEPWVGSCGYAGSFARFDGAKWVEVYPFPEPELLCIVDLVTAPDGAIWASTLFPNPADGGWSWAVARNDGEAWTVYAPSDIGPEQRSLGQMAIGPDGSVWVATDRGLARFDGRSWSVHLPTRSFTTVSIGPDGSVWAAGAVGPPRLQPSGADPEP